METGKIKSLLEKYWAGESSLEEENAIKAYYQGADIDKELMHFKALFNYYDESKEITLEKSIESMIPAEEAKVISFGRLRAIAAAVIILAVSVFGINYLSNQKEAKEKQMMAMEVADPEEAYELTKEALAYLSSNFEKGSKSLNKLPAAMESTIIFK